MGKKQTAKNWEAVKEKYREIGLKKGWLRDSEATFCNAVDKQCYGRCRCPHPHEPSDYMKNKLYELLQSINK